MRSKGSPKQVQDWKDGKYSNWPPHISKETLKKIKEVFKR